MKALIETETLNILDLKVHRKKNMTFLKFPVKRSVERIKPQFEAI